MARFLRTGFADLYHFPAARRLDCPRKAGSVMTALVALIAPRTWADAVWKGAVLLILISILNYGLIVAVHLTEYRFRTDFLNTLLVALPFVVIFMLTLRHQLDLQHRLTLLATTDMLTGLPNRRAFLARAAEATRNGQAGVLLLLDADHFKRINDTWGHAVGDLCLTAIAQQLQRNLRPGDLVGRIGGEEFSIFLPGADLSQAQQIGNRLCAAIKIEAAGVEQILQVTLSIGAAFGDSRISIDTLMVQADFALYRAKAEGRARMVIWQQGGIAV